MWIGHCKDQIQKRCFNKGQMLKISASKSRYSGQITLSAQLMKQIYRDQIIQSMLQMFCC